MKDKCENCKSSFNESPFRYARRLRKNEEKLCNDCFRIKHAEANREKREKHKDNAEAKKVNEMKKSSIPLLQRKFNMSYQEAVEFKRIFK